MLVLPRSFGIVPASEVRRLVCGMRIELDAPTRERWLARLAGRQHGVVSRTQMLALGFSTDAIGRRLRVGRLHAVHRGVYAVGHVALSRDGRAMAAVLAVSEAAALGGRSALTRRGVVTWGGSAFDVVVESQHGRLARRPGLAVSRTRALPTYDVSLVRGVPTVTTVRALSDLATVLTDHRWEQAVDEAQKAGVQAAELAARCPRARVTLGLSIAAPTRSGLEVRFLEILRDAGLPLPRVNHPVQRKDGVWVTPDGVYERPRRIAIELDSRTHHLSDLAWRADAERDRQLQMADWLVLRYPWWVVVHTPHVIVDELSKLLAR